MESVQTPGPWRHLEGQALGAGGLAWFLEVKELGGRLGEASSHPTGPRPGWILGSWWLWRHQLIAPDPPTPIPPRREGSTRVLLLQVEGKKTMQVIRFKLKIIQN